MLLTYVFFPDAAASAVELIGSPNWRSPFGLHIPWKTLTVFEHPPVEVRAGHLHSADYQSIWIENYDPTSVSYSIDLQGRRLHAPLLPEPVPEGQTPSESPLSKVPGWRKDVERGNRSFMNHYSGNTMICSLEGAAGEGGQQYILLAYNSGLNIYNQEGRLIHREHFRYPDIHGIWMLQEGGKHYWLLWRSRELLIWPDPASR